MEQILRLGTSEKDSEGAAGVFDDVAGSDPFPDPSLDTDRHARETLRSTGGCRH